MSDQRIKDLDKYCKIPASKRSVVITLLSAVGVTIQRRLRCRYAGLTRAIRTAKAPARIKQGLRNVIMAANIGSSDSRFHRRQLQVNRPTMPLSD